MKLRPFELGLVLAFAGLAALSLVLLSSFKGSGDDNVVTVGKVVVWGTVSQDTMNNLLREISDGNEQYKNVSYRQIAESSLEDELTNALADANGPDVLLFPHEHLVSLRKRLRPISFDTLPIRDVRTTYIDGAEIFALSDGMYAYPIAVDPLMLYWNKNILTNAGYLSAPSTWESLVNDYLPTLIERDFDRTINRGVVALGEYNNVRNAFPIISMLLLQSGSKFVSSENSFYNVSLDESVTGTGRPLQVAASFYTRFSQPNNTLYSWNRSFEEDRAEFVSEDLVLYFGLGSEGLEIERLNPNLSFDIAEVPQGASATVRRTYGRIYGVGALKTSQNLPGAGAVLALFSSTAVSERIALDNRLVPAQRVSIAKGSNDNYGRLAYKSAVVAYGWLSPRPSATANIFQTMTRDITENRAEVGDATDDAIDRLRVEYN